MTPHADGARGQAEPATDRRGVELVPIGQLEERTVVRRQAPERSEEARPLLLGNESGQRALGPGVRGRSAEALQGLPLAPGRAAPVQAEAQRGLVEVPPERL